MSESVTIYALRDPRTEQIRYIGKTKQKVGYRLTQHVHLANQPDVNSYVLNWLRQLLEADLLPEIHILEIVGPDVDWQERERFWIAYGLSEGWPLTNLTEGGEGITNPSEELRHGRSERMRGNTYAIGNRNGAGPRSEAFKRRMAEVAKVTKNALGHKLSQSVKQQISDKLRTYYENGGEAVHGEANGQSKLTAEQVREIRKRYANGGVSMRGLAESYPVSYATVHNIIHRSYWRHID